MSSITVRRMDFHYPPDMELVFIDSDPNFSAAFLGTWFTLPYLEPYLMRTLRGAIDQVRDPALRADIRQFCAQEGQHYQEHARANEVILSRCPSGPAKDRLLADIETCRSEYEAFSQERPQAFNLAYAEGFEAYTCAGARTQLELRVFDHMSGPIRDLMLWHIMEEVEHRSVAFDVYEHLVGRYFHRVRWGAWAQRHFIAWGARLAADLKACLPEVFGRQYDEQAIARRKQRMKSYLANALPKILATYSPRYSPHRVDLPPMFEEARAHYRSLAAPSRP